MSEKVVRTTVRPYIDIPSGGYPFGAHIEVDVKETFHNGDEVVVIPANEYERLRLERDTFENTLRKIRDLLGQIAPIRFVDPKGDANKRCELAYGLAESVAMIGEGDRTFSQVSEWLYSRGVEVPESAAKEDK
jgi:PHD/YefM family antitoxin component YafN of YafNO toxin-antitoxin module